ncbi:hypothetical protein BKA61DRAFT_583917 [Leptodontidium sp. MPI-SDFR-AT-0119]|nr:hypothetical protein BKA61DRAFT_583917 [Leptodontidium sp. MPI-SDFR-AT-0119]
MCILQDYHDDWIREAAKMGSYYGHSALTITAGDASCGDDGFLRPRDPGAVDAAPLGVYSFPDKTERDMLDVIWTNVVGHCRSELCLLEQFTSLIRLTMPDDKLPAISGLAGRMAHWSSVNHIWHQVGVGLLWMGKFSGRA